MKSIYRHGSSSSGKISSLSYTLLRTVCNSATGAGLAIVHFCNDHMSDHMTGKLKSRFFRIMGAGVFMAFLLTLVPANADSHPDTYKRPGDTGIVAVIENTWGPLNFSQLAQASGQAVRYINPIITQQLKTEVRTAESDTSTGIPISPGTNWVNFRSTCIGIRQNSYRIFDSACSGMLFSDAHNGISDMASGLRFAPVKSTDKVSGIMLAPADSSGTIAAPADSSGTIAAPADSSDTYDGNLPYSEKALLGETAQPSPDSVSTENYIWPAQGNLTSGFGYRNASVGSKNHKGIDICASTGDPIYAAAAGDVTVSERNGSFGYYIQIKHDNGHVSLYAHCSALLVDVGERVAQGQLIALMGRTGRATAVHVHFELIIDGVNVDPVLHLPDTR